MCIGIDIPAACVAMFGERPGRQEPGESANRTAGMPAQEEGKTSEQPCRLSIVTVSGNRNDWHQWRVVAYARHLTENVAADIGIDRGQ
jgi:hypothetical protein